MTRRRDYEAEQDLARRREELGIVDTEEPIITTPHDRRNGKKWWQETVSKATGGVLAFVVIAVLTGAWAKAKVGATATFDLYSLRPEVNALRTDVDALRARPEMTQAQVKSLAAQIADELKKKGK